MSARSHTRSAERHILSPSVDASFGQVGVSIKDISESGVRVKHDLPLEAGNKSILRFRTEEKSAVALEAVVVWTQPVTTPEESGQFVSGFKLFADRESVGGVITEFGERRSNRIEEYRSTDRFILSRPLRAELGSYGVVRIEDLSSRGVRIENTRKLGVGSRGTLRFQLPDHTFEVSVEAEVVWSQLKAIWSADENRYDAGLRIVQRHEFLRLAIGHLREIGLALQDTRSLKLKLRLMPIRKAMRREGENPSDRVAVVGAVRRSFEECPESAPKWLQRAERIQSDPSINGIAGPIATDSQALAVWEFLDRTIDPSLIAMSFGLR